MTASRISQESSPPDKIPDSETDSPRDKEQDVPASPLEVPDGEGGAAIAPTATAASERPLHSIFGPGMKRFVIAMTIFAMLFSPVASFIYLPALTPIAEDYHRSVGEINLSVTLYQVMQAIAPLFFADLSDQIGRRPVYMITFTIFSAANIGLALQDSYPALLVLRALQSTGSSAVIAIGSAIVSDLVTSAERGSYVSVVQGSVQFAPAIAPILGGILTQYLGWRSVFWFLLIATAVFLLIYMPFVPEVSLLYSSYLLWPPC